MRKNWHIFYLMQINLLIFKLNAKATALINGIEAIPKLQQTRFLASTRLV